MPDDQTARTPTREESVPPALLAMVRRAVDDLETLLNTLSARSDKTLAQIVERAAAKEDPLLASAAAFTHRCAEIMATPPETIARRTDLLADLIRARDLLNTASWPATADTFRLTAFYTGKRRLDEENGTAAMFRDDARAMTSTRWTMRAIAVVALVALTYTIMLSAAALNGRSTVADNRAIRADLDNTAEMIARLAAPALGVAFPDAIVGEATRDLRVRPCDARVPVLVRAGSTPVEVIAFRDPDHVGVCDRYNDRLRQLQINEAQILDWNRWVDRLFFGIRPRVTPQTQIGAAEPERVLAVSERAVSARVDDIAAMLLPLYGFIGAAAFVFRRLMQKVQAAELDATEVRQAIIRLALGTILGGVIGLFFGPDGAALAGDGLPIKALGLSALALLAGYAVELVFTFFDFIIRALFTPLKTGAQPGQPAGQAAR
ncbi:hypothetical protein [Elioraea tepidiphila]|jgi:hypothetical protein|uniref:hypothetical protein n=1 Tax=Elioraea tepidiphila TaxID=457934 RepID=UPI000372E529|nr:hypothetical protein [Elioraea tepidiphila]